MPDPLLFVIGVLVTAIVALAVWSVGLIDPIESETDRHTPAGNSPQRELR